MANCASAGRSSRSVPLLGDVRDRRRVEAVIAGEQPQIVFHAAALKHVPMVEANPIEGVLTNVIGTRNVAEAARAFGAALVVMISTDKAVDPASVMGATKRLAESFCQALDLHEARRGRAAGHAVPDGAVRQRAGFDRIGRAAVHAPARRRRTADRDPSRGQPLFHDGARGGRAGARGVLDGARSGAGRDARGKIFVLDMGEPVKIVDLARQMIRLAGKRPDRDIAIVYTGLRPGEKLHEALFHAAEAPIPTANPALRLAAPRTADYAVLARSIEELEEQARAGNRRAGARPAAPLGSGIPGREPAGTGNDGARGRNGLTPARRTGYGAAGRKPSRRPSNAPYEARPMTPGLALSVSAFALSVWIRPLMPLLRRIEANSERRVASSLIVPSR